MSSATFRILAVLFAASLTAYAFQASPTDRPWPPDVQKVGTDSPPLTPAAALETFYMPPGYRLELVASEPLVQDPVAMDWDPAGRLWVVEMPGWMPDITAAREHDPIGRVVVLQDGDGDGRMDRRTVYADGLVLARSIKVLDRGVLVGEPPNVWFMRDTDGDLRADMKELVTDRYGRRDIDPQNNANGFYWALDNRMYTAGQADIHLQLKNGAFEVHRTLPRGEWGVTQDDGGRIYRNTNESALHVDLVPTHYYARNPNLLRTRGSYDRLATGNEDLNIVWPVRPNPGTNRAYQAGIDRPDGTLVRFTSVCAPVVYRGDRLPGELYGNVFVAEPAANLVSRLVLDDHGRELRGRKAYARGEFLASTDERFRPVYLSNAPDGTLYIVDLYRGIIEHRISITEYLRDHIVARKLSEPTGLGRIYRVVHDTTRRDSPRFEATTPAQLVDALSHPNGWRRETAQRLLVERSERRAVEPLVKLATGAKDWRTRLHALWTLDGLDAIEPDLVMRALQDPSRDVRTSAVRLSERWLGEPGHPIHTSILQRVEDPEPAVRRQLAASMGLSPAAVRDPVLTSLLRRDGGDPVVVDAALSSMRGDEDAILQQLLTSSADVSDPAARAGVEGALIMLAATVVRSARESAIQSLFAWTTDETRPEWLRSSLLRGAEVALVGAAMPATAAPRPVTAGGVVPPCPTCPGGRAGPGGAYAFPRPGGGTQGGRGAGPRLRLTREPAPLTEAATRGGDTGARAAALLARIAWPGKPGEESIRALTAAEQGRFDAGRDVYRNVCQSCHQADGRGQERIAPGLVDSMLTLASADIPARILLNGKEGPIGLMPPIGGALSDEQIASVLTYVRREWGQGGEPVDAAAVATVRALTAARTRPWRHDELIALAASSGRGGH